ncbi:MAG: DUF1326 domain-containing protein [Armatimonadetes bacterium]|nr:DUF1326 domain-containing protein [Armatimonadota bacterium]
MNQSRFAFSVVVALAAVGTSFGSGKKPMPFEVKGMFVEGCSCSAPCPCEIVGLEMGCQGVGGMALTGGSYNGVSLAGAKLAYATEPGNWVRLYVQAKNPSQRKAIEALGRAVYSGFGKIESVSEGAISVTNKGGNFTLTVNGGKIMTLKTTPILGHDKKPVIINNMNDPIHPDNMLGKSTACSFSDGGRSFTLSDRNVFWTDKLNTKGKI